MDVSQFSIINLKTTYMSITKNTIYMYGNTSLSDDFRGWINLYQLTNTRCITILFININLNWSEYTCLTIVSFSVFTIKELYS